MTLQISSYLRSKNKDNWRWEIRPKSFSVDKNGDIHLNEFVAKKETIEAKVQEKTSHA